MSHLPLNIDISGMSALVIGGGLVAGRKVASLLQAGARIHVVAPELSPEILQLAASGSVTARKGRYSSGDLRGVFLAVAATNDRSVNLEVASQARKQGVLVVVADDPAAGNCTFPALLRRGELEISVSTGGACPGYAAEVRDVLEGLISPEYGQILCILAKEREKLLTESSNSTYNKQILRSRARELINELNSSKERVP